MQQDQSHSQYPHPSASSFGPLVSLAVALLRVLALPPSAAKGYLVGVPVNEKAGANSPYFGSHALYGVEGRFSICDLHRPKAQDVPCPSVSPCIAADGPSRDSCPWSLQRFGLRMRSRIQGSHNVWIYPSDSGCLEEHRRYE
jgi:hypothetical protein